MDLSAATSEATALQSSEGAAVPEAASGGLFKGPDEGYMVKLHGTERVTKEEGGESSAPAVNITITGNEITIPDETYLNKMADEISTRVAREWNRKLRYV
jgi:hypothetical protein